eukprot:s1082_g3.t3
MAAGNVHDWNKAIHACGKTHDWPRALRLLAEVAVEGLQSTVVTYNTVLRVCEWRCAQSLLRSLRDATLRRDSISLASSVSSVASGSCWAEAARLLAASVLTALLPNLICSSASLAASASAVVWRSAVGLLQWVQLGGFRADAVACNSAAAACGNAAAWRQSLALAATHRNGWGLRGLLRAFSRDGHWQSALCLLSDSTRRPPNADGWKFYSSAMSACEPTTAWSCALCLLAGSRATDATSVAGFSACASALGSSRRWDLSLLLLEVQGACRATLDLISYNTAIAACEKAARWEQALLLLEQLPLANLRADAVSFNACISACEACARWEVALGLLDQIHEAKCLPDVVSYSAAISAMEKGFQWTRALSLLLEMSQVACLPDVICFNAALGACESCGAWEEAMTLWSGLLSSSLQPDVVTIGALLGACGKAHLWQLSLEWLGDIGSRQLIPDIITYNAAATACHGASAWQQIALLLESMVTRDCPANILTLDVAVSAADAGRAFGPLRQLLHSAADGALGGLRSLQLRQESRPLASNAQVVGRHEGRKHRRAAVQEHHRTSGSYWSNRSTKHGRLPRHLDEEPRDVRGQGRTEPPTTGTAGIAGAAFAMLRIFAVSLPAASNRASCCVQRKHALACQLLEVELALHSRHAPEYGVARGVPICRLSVLRCMEETRDLDYLSTSNVLILGGGGGFSAAAGALQDSAAEGGVILHARTPDLALDGLPHAHALEDFGNFRCAYDLAPLARAVLGDWPKRSAPTKEAEEMSAKVELSFAEYKEWYMSSVSSSFDFDWVEPASCKGLHRDALVDPTGQLPL